MTSGKQRLAGGRAVVLREAGQADVPAIARLYSELSAESFRDRFQSGQPVPALVLRLAALAPVPEAVSLVATAAGAPERLVGEARYVLTGPGAAEFGLTVLDSYQGAGLGRLLLAALVTRASQAGLQRLQAIVSLGNLRMLRLLASYQWVLAEPTDGSSSVCLEFSVAGGMPGWPAGTAGRRALVEQRGWYGSIQASALQAAGFEVRQCTGPRRESGRECPLLTSGHCRLAEEADRIVCLLPHGDADCAAVLAAHQRRWPSRLSA